MHVSSSTDLRRRPGPCGRNAFMAACLACVAVMTVSAGAAAQDEAADPPSTPPAATDAVPEGLTPPQLIEQVDAEYPPAAFEDDVEADVVVQLEIDATGAVVSVTPQELVYYTYDASGAAIEDPRALDDDPYGFVPNAVAAAQAYRFEPAIFVDEASPEGRPVPVQLAWRVGFVIDVEEVTTPVEVAETGDDVRIDPEGPVNFTGRLLERGTRRPLVGFVVALRGPDALDEPLETSTVTDADGGFSFAGLPGGEWTVVIDEVDYFRAESREALSASELTDVTYFIERNSYGEYVSTTTAERPRREVTRRTLEVTEIQRIPGNNNDAIRVVQNLPGVARASFGGGDVIIRGSAPEDTGFYLDGMPIPAVYHFGGLRAVFPSEILGEIEFLPGGFGAEYGGVTGGIVNVTTSDDGPERVSGHVDVNLIDTGVFLETPLGDNVFLQVGGRRSYIDAVLKPIAPAIGLDFATAPRYYDGQARVVAELADRHTLSLIVYGSDDLLDLVLEDESDLDPNQRGGIRTRLSFYGAQVGLRSRLADDLTNDLRIQAYRAAFGFSLGTELFFDLNTTEYSFRDTLTWEPSDRFTLRYGLDIDVQPFDIAVSLPRPPKEGEEPGSFGAADIITTDESGNWYEPAQWVELDIRPTERLQLVPGLRQGWYRQVEQWEVDPRLMVRYGITDAATIKAAVGRYHQPPVNEELSEEFGNPALGLERAWHYVVGTEYQFTDTISLGVDLFYKQLGELVSRSDDVVERGGEVVPEVYDNGGVGRVYGAELLLRHEPSERFFGWIAYTLSRSERRDSGSSEYRLFDFDQTHILTLLGSYNLPKNWSIGARFRLVSGNPTTPIVGSVYDADADQYIRVTGEANSVRQLPFHQLDVRVDKRWIYDRWTLNAYLDLQNVYNRMNPEGVTYSYDFSEEAIITGLPLLPSFGIRAEF